MTISRPVIAGNWKMNHGPRATRDFLKRLRLSDDLGPAQVLLFPPAVSLSAAAECADRDARVELGVQDVHEADSGAFTGEISAPMAGEAGARYALCGHSERRHVFGESDARVAAKIEAVRRAGLVPVVCVGETLDERAAGQLEVVLLRQLGSALEALGSDAPFMIAYEPVWAIGTGETATPGDASEAHGVLRARLIETLGPAADAVPILYGGSVRPANAAELLAAPGVDGLLVGGASLDPESFGEIVAAARG